MTLGSRSWARIDRQRRFQKTHKKPLLFPPVLIRASSHAAKVPPTARTSFGHMAAICWSRRRIQIEGMRQTPGGYCSRRLLTNSAAARKAYRPPMMSAPPVARASDPNSVPAASTVSTLCRSGPLKARARLSSASAAADPKTLLTLARTASRPSSPMSVCVTTMRRIASKRRLGGGGRAGGGGCGAQARGQWARGGQQSGRP
mmetsp:Transcript_27450/g.83517  ORF Transcript_27450/g.83517 Transcript_27450/m.83517 type:complete len:202 (+) Transcript_27450:80-685(+)